MRDLLQEIFASLGRNKLRTALTGISVSTGIFLLITLLGAGNGLINAFRHNSRQFATNTLYVSPGYRTKPYDGLSQWSSVTFDNRDIRTLQTAFGQQVDRVIGTAELGPLNASHGDQYMNCRITGAEPAQQEVDKVMVMAGRFVNETDIRNFRKSIVVPRRMANTLFGDAGNAIGQILDIDHMAFRVVGVYSDLSQGGMGNTPQCYAALSTTQLLKKSDPDLSSLLVQTDLLADEAGFNLFESSLRHNLSQLHRFAPDDETAVFTYNAAQGAQETEKAFGIIRTSLWVVGLLTLLSGVAGISNIMLITVRERTHEFGIRKALGARPWSILKAVLLESVIVTAFFGYLGLVLGVAGTEIMNRVAGTKTLTIMGMTQYYFLNPTVDLSIAFQALAVLIAAGLVAGFLPAWKAVRIRPIEALNAK